MERFYFSGLRVFVFALAWVCFSLSAMAYEGERSDWQGFERYDFKLNEVPCVLVVPKKVGEGRPWVWRARFFGHEPQADIALLEKGYHLAYCDVAGLFGGPEAVARWDAFYAHVLGKYNLARKVALEGMSRGGLIIYNWAASNPDKVACLYGDAPVCDIRSWPGGKGAGPGSEGDWKLALAVYGLTDETAVDFKGNPVDRLEPLARAGIPILHVIGEADEVVPVAENSDIVEERYRQLSGSIQVIRKPGVGHHPHALKDPAPIVDFITKHVSAALAAKSPFSANVLVRAGLPHAGKTFSQKRLGNVAFIGGSITEMDGYRPMVCALLEDRFPETRFTFTDAGIASTCSTTGAFRLEEDVLSKGPVDLLFVEFAVNDDQDAAHARRESIRGLEGIIRHALRSNPAMDIIVTYFVNPRMLQVLREGGDPVSIAAHEAVTARYGVPVIHLAREVAERITTGRLTWEQFGGTHPAPYGNRLCADLIDELFDATWSGAGVGAGLTESLVPSQGLPSPLDPSNYENGRFIEWSSAVLPEAGWELATPDWTSLKGQCRDRFREAVMLSAVEPNKTLTLAFEGAAIGAYVLAGPDAGIAEVAIDGGAWKQVSLYHRFSEALHYPRTVLFGTDLGPGKHTLQLRAALDPAHGAAVRILHFVAN